ncbi:MAG TPA: tetrahydrodipicolinate N-succinyltransferase N-terminal domain-containing protein [SAR86 cluster bacterium]|nr:tetrahydrodipicolinate N-succinyltransferase N-terminal domain-containing protein [SAR86 cluster bacterium]
MDTFPLIATGVASTSLDGEILAIRYTKIVSLNDRKDEFESLDSLYQQMEKEGSDFTKLAKKEGQILKEREKLIVHKISEDTPVENVKDAYLKLHLLSMKLVKPNTVNLEGIFSALPNVAWTNQGPIHPNDLEKLRPEYDSLYIRSLDKFPCLTDYVIPNGVRIADASRVRLGAYLSEGTTIMHEGFVNFNAGTLGPSMIEGRISAGVVIGKNSDLGGGCSTMGTLSGGNDVKISVGEDCLLGANSGLGIPLGDRCIVEAGLYLTAGSKVEVIDENNKIIKTVKASELSSKNDQLFIRNSLTGAIQCKANTKSVSLNDQLHKND